MNPLYHTAEEIQERIYDLEQQLNPAGYGDTSIGQEQIEQITEEIEVLKEWL